MNPMLIHATTSKEQLHIGVEIVFDTCTTLNNFAYNKSLTASQLCSCEKTGESAIHLKTETCPR